VETISGVNDAKGLKKGRGLIKWSGSGEGRSEYYLEVHFKRRYHFKLHFYDFECVIA